MTYNDYAAHVAIPISLLELIYKYLENTAGPLIRKTVETVLDGHETVAEILERECGKK